MRPETPRGGDLLFCKPGHSLALSWEGLSIVLWDSSVPCLPHPFQKLVALITKRTWCVSDLYLSRQTDCYGFNVVLTVCWEMSLSSGENSQPADTSSLLSSQGLRCSMGLTCFLSTVYFVVLLARSAPPSRAHDKSFSKHFLLYCCHRLEEPKA